MSASTVRRRPAARTQQHVVAKTVLFGYAVLVAGERFMEELLERARTVSRALRAAGVPHAIIGGLAVRAHVASVDPGAAMTTRDMDVLMRRADIPRAAVALAPLGYRERSVLGIPAFVQKGKSFRDAVHLVLAGEKLRTDALYPAPELIESRSRASKDGFPVIDLAQLVVMKLTSFRHKDIVHLQAFLELGLITPEVEKGLPADLAGRLQQVKQDSARESLGDA